MTSTDTTVEERSKVSLRCGASGYPPPHISWRKENNKDINLGSVGTTKNIGKHFFLMFIYFANGVLPVK